MLLTFASSAARSTPVTIIGNLLRVKTASGASLLRGSGLNREPGHAPLGKTFKQPVRATSARAQHFDGSVCVDTVRAAAVRDVIFAPGKFFEPPLQFIHWNGGGAGHVSCCIFAGGSRVEDNDVL